MYTKQHGTRSKSTASLKPKSSLFLQIPQKSSQKAVKTLQRPKRSLTEISLKPKSQKTSYIPSFLRTPSKDPKIPPKNTLLLPRKFSQKTLHSKPLASNPSKTRSSFIIKLKESFRAPTYPKSFIQKYISKTRIGTILGKPKPHNQDSFFAFDNFSTKNQSFFGVLDGHGMFGHDISTHVKHMLPHEIEKNFPLELNSKFLSASVLSELSQAFLTGFSSIQKRLKKKGQIDASFSGTTANLAFVHGKNLLCANVGDSRAVIGRFCGEWEAVELSQDHKPNTDSERRRIEKCGGRVEPVRDSQGNYVGPFRVWLKDQQLPGLAMSRSIGDLVASSVGVTAEPDILLYTLNPFDKFLVLATDGVWEFINSLTCVKIISSFYETGNIELAAEELLKFAVDMWNMNEKTSDDITFIIIFFNVI